MAAIVDKSVDQVVSAEVQNATGRKCRSAFQPALRSFLSLLDRASSNGVIEMEQVRKLAVAFLRAEGPMADYYRKCESACAAAFAEHDLDRHRHDHFGRLVAKSFSELFGLEPGGVERRHLPQFFQALKMMMGEELHAELRARANLIAEAHRDEEGLIRWADFHADPRSVKVLDRVRVQVSKSFQRFDIRKDWFVLVMNQVSAGVSLSSSTFVQKSTADRDVPVFTPRHMLQLFSAMFADFDPRCLAAERRAVFGKVENAEDLVIKFRSNLAAALLH
jgi:hypothetical protein